MLRTRSAAAAIPWWHAVNRSASREAFRSRADCEGFLDLAATGCKHFAVEIHAFCLMESHYHLLLRATRANLVRFLQQVEEGHVDRRAFRRPFRTGSIRAEPHLVHASRYIHLNPVQAGLVERAEDWPFSSYRAYLDPALAPVWLTTSRVLRAFGSVGARRLYRCFVEEGLSRRLSRDRSALAVFDDQEFRDELRRRAALELPGGRAPARLPGRDRRPPLAALARLVSEIFAVPIESLRRASDTQGRGNGLARGAFVHAAQGFGGYRLIEIAAWMGYGSPAAAARAAIRFARETRRDREHLRRLAALRARVDLEERVQLEVGLDVVRPGDLRRTVGTADEPA